MANDAEMSQYTSEVMAGYRYEVADELPAGDPYDPDYDPEIEAGSMTLVYDVDECAMVRVPTSEVRAGLLRAGRLAGPNEDRDNDTETQAGVARHEQEMHDHERQEADDLMAQREADEIEAGQ